MALHEHAALGGLIAIAVHGITLLGDRWLDPGPAGIAVPFVMDYRPVYTGLGIVAGYLAAALGLSFYARKRIGAKLWRKLHRATIARVRARRDPHARRRQRRGVGAPRDADHRRADPLPAALRMLPQRPRGERRTPTGTSAVPGAS